MSLRATWAIAKKDFLDALRTLRLLAFILLPVGFSLFYQVILASAGDIITARVVIHDAGASRLPQILAREGNIRIIAVGSVDELKRVVIESRAIGGIALPPGYDKAMIKGQRPSLRLFINGQLQTSEPQFLYLLEPALRAQARQNSPAIIETLTVNIGPDSGFRPGFDLEHFLLVMFITMGSTMTAVMIPASMLVEEKETHTLKAVMTTPASYVDFVAGKGIAGLIYTLFSGGMILALNGGLGGKVLLTLLELLLSGLFLVGVGLLLGTLFDSMIALNAWSFAITLPLTLPGVLVPAIDLGLLNLGLAARILHAIPTYYMVDAIQRTVNGLASFKTVGIDLLVLLASSVLVFAVTLLYHRRGER